MSVLEADDLRAAWSKIDRPWKWCRYEYHKGAVQHCMIGAVRDAVANEQRIDSALIYLENAIGGRRIKDANDDPATTHDDVRRWFAEAIARAEAEG